MQNCMPVEYSRRMVALQIRDVPDTIRDALVNEARRREQSLQVYLLDVLAHEAAVASNRRWLERHRSDPSRSRRAVDPQQIVDDIVSARQARGA